MCWHRCSTRGHSQISNPLIQYILPPETPSSLDMRIRPRRLFVFSVAKMFYLPFRNMVKAWQKRVLRTKKTKTFYTGLHLIPDLFVDFLKSQSSTREYLRIANDQANVSITRVTCSVKLLSAACSILVGCNVAYLINLVSSITVTESGKR